METGGEGRGSGFSGNPRAPVVCGVLRQDWNKDTWRLNGVSRRGPEGWQTGRYTRQPGLWPNPDFFEVMALAQHHGVPTRLLDWTRNPYAAAYFAASSAVTRAGESNKAHRLAVWVLNIEMINLYRRVNVVRIPGSVSAHLAAQDGLFTAHPHNGLRGKPFETVGLEEEFSTHPGTPLMKLTAPVEESVRLLELCDKIGINAATMYPGADGAGRAVMESLNSWIAKTQIFGK